VRIRFLQRKGKRGREDFVLHHGGKGKYEEGATIMKGKLDKQSQEEGTRSPTCRERKRKKNIKEFLQR